MRSSAEGVPLTEHDPGYDQPGEEDRTVYRERPAQPWPQGHPPAQPSYDDATQAYQRPQVPPPAGPGQTGQARVQPPPPPPPPPPAPPGSAPPGPGPGGGMPGGAGPGGAATGGAWAGQAGPAAAGPRAAWTGAPAPPPQTDARGFVASLFDFSFTSFVTPKVIKVLYALIMIGVALSAVIFIAIAFRANSFFGLISLFILAPLYFLVVMATYRIGLEFFMVMFRISEDVRAIRQRNDTR
jgi:Domain of unknown function (DUF4282)